jgi:hypothetical protein
MTLIAKSDNDGENPKLIASPQQTPTRPSIFLALAFRFFGRGRGATRFGAFLVVFSLSFAREKMGFAGKLNPAEQSYLSSSLAGNGEVLLSRPAAYSF